MKCNVTIPCFFSTAEEIKQQELGIDIGIPNKTNVIHFYEINAISKTTYSSGEEFGTILVNNSEFITPKSYEELKAIFDKEYEKNS